MLSSYALELICIYSSNTDFLGSGTLWHLNWFRWTSGLHPEISYACFHQISRITLDATWFSIWYNVVLLLAEQKSLNTWPELQDLSAVRKNFSNNLATYWVDRDGSVPGVKVAEMFSTHQSSVVQLHDVITYGFTFHLLSLVSYWVTGTA